MTEFHARGVEENPTYAIRCGAIKELWPDCFLHCVEPHGHEGKHVFQLFWEDE